MQKEFELFGDIVLHVSEVQENLEIMASELRKRGFAHDRTKFQETEFDAFCSTREKFKKANYGSPEYQECIDIIKPAIDHHYQNNRHHTKYHKNGFRDMTLIDVLEMIADWKAAARRSPDKPHLIDTLNDAFKKYEIGEEMQGFIRRTVYALWQEGKEVENG